MKPKTPVALLISTSVLALSPGTLRAQAESSPEVTLSAVRVEASADASAQGLSPEYPGGQVARGGKAGILGTRDNLETPFSITSYTSELIQNQQARSVSDVLQNDASVRVARGYGNFQESYFIRGFILTSDEVAYNGLYNLLPRQYIASELFERIEVFRGASDFLTGASPAGGTVGGGINLLPKRAPNEALSQASAGFASGSQASVSMDVARRFGADQSTGVRVVAAHREGGSAVDDEHSQLDVFLIGLDWRSGSIRLSGDFGYQNNELDEIRPNVTLGAAAGVVPGAPENTLNYAQPWTYSNERDHFGTVRGEMDFNDRWTGWFAGGMRRSDEDNSLAGLTVSNGYTGNGAVNARFDNTRKDEVSTGEIGLRGRLASGPVNHTLVGALSRYYLDKKTAYAMSKGYAPASNLYDPAYTAAPALAIFGNDLDDPDTTGKTGLSSAALGYTLGAWEDRLQLTAGIRRQQLTSSSYAYNTGARTAHYDTTRNTPMGSLLFRIQNNLSVYINYIESLNQGGTASGKTAAGAPVLNLGEVMDPYVSKQKEIGMKYDSGRTGYGLAWFSTKKPRALITDTGYYTIDGEDRHQGVEFSLFGEIMRALRLIGGVTWLDAEQRSTGSAATDGKKVIGVPAWQGNINLEWDMPYVAGLTLDTRMIATQHSYADAANTLRAPGWTRFDLGLRYMTGWSDHLVTLRARLENVADQDYWSSVGGYPGQGYLVSGAPRTFMLSASVNF